MAKGAGAGRAGTVEAEAYLAILRAAAAVQQPVADLLKGHGLSPVQYNVLRILRGAGAHGLNASDIADRMIHRDPDVTRLLDRLEGRGLVDRWRCTHDRRVVWTRATEEGLALLASLDGPIDALHVAQLGHLGRERLETLIGLLEAARPETP